jgi:hypothetical protein
VIFLIANEANSCKSIQINLSETRTMSNSEGIPIRRMVVHDAKDMPLHYGETPGGSIFSTTPGGKQFIGLEMRTQKCVSRLFRHAHIL